MDSSYATIRQAILNKYQVIGEYHGHRREMCPHVIGTKNGEAHVLCYQFAGGSQSGLGPDGSKDNWRCIRIAEFRNVTTRAGSWHTAPNHSRPQSCVDEIDVEVKV